MGGDVMKSKYLILGGGMVAGRMVEIEGATLSGVHYLRSLDDSKSLRTHAGNAKRAVVVGSGFIAMEVASVLAQKGVETPMVVRDERIWSKIFTPAMSRSFENYFAARGVQFLMQSEVKEVRGREAVTSVVLKDRQTI